MLILQHQCLTTHHGTQSETKDSAPADAAGEVGGLGHDDEGGAEGEEGAQDQHTGQLPGGAHCGLA